MVNKLEIINPKEFGLEEEKANELTIGLNPILEERKILTTQYNELMKEGFSSEVARKARTLRLLIGSNRTKGITPWHKVNKEFFLTGGRFVDAIKNKEVRENERMEGALMEIEKRAETLEAERIKKEEEIEKDRLEKLQTKRVTLISDYLEDAVERDLAIMDEDVWIAFFDSKKQIHIEKVKSEKLEEEKRIAEAKRIEKENTKLRKEAEELETKNKIEEEKRKKEENERLKKEEEARKIQENKLQKERESREKLEKEVKNKKLAEEKAESDRLQAIQDELNKGDSAKIKDLISDLEALKTKYEFKSVKNSKIYGEVGLLIDKVVGHINK